MPQRNVLHVNEAEEQAALMNAISRIIVGIQADTGDTLVDIAERIGCTVVTISNAVNRKSVLSLPFVLRIGRAYGGDRINPVLALIDGHFAPSNPVVDPELLQACADLLAWYGRATHPGSPGGAAIIYSELLEGEAPAETMRRHATGIVEAARKVRAA